MTVVDELAIDFVVDGIAMKLTPAEREIAARRMLGLRVTSEIARLTCVSTREIQRLIARIEGTTHCPLCHQIVYLDGDRVRRHVDVAGQPWCEQSGRAGAQAVPTINSMRRGKRK